MTWKHPHSPVKKKLKTVQSPGKVMATVFWDVHSSFGGFHTSQFNNKCNCLSGNSKETQGGYSVQETKIVDQRTQSSSFARQCSTSQCCRNRESLELLGLGYSSISTIQSRFCTVGLPSTVFSKMKKHLRGQRFHSNEDVQNEVKKWLCAQDTFFSMKDLTNLYCYDKCLNRLGDYRYDKCLNRLGDCVEK
jgi:hypothetical protein